MFALYFVIYPMFANHVDWQTFDIEYEGQIQGEEKRELCHWTGNVQFMQKDTEIHAQYTHIERNCLQCWFAYLLVLLLATAHLTIKIGAYLLYC